jgi:hypothetical protein
VWKHDGTPFATFTTVGQTFPSVHFADLDGDGKLELIAADNAGYVYVWNRDKSLRFQKQVQPWCGGQAPTPTPCQPSQLAITSSPLTVDLDGDGKLEILVIAGLQIVVFDAQGNQLSDPGWPFLGLGNFSGTPALGDVDGDGYIDIVTAGDLFSSALKKTTVFVWRWDPVNARLRRFGRRQFAPEPAGLLEGLASLAALAALRRARASG